MKSFLRLVIFSALTFNLLFAYSGGSGTEDDPYQIATFEDLIQLSDSSADWDKYFIQTADINMAATATMNIGGGDTLGFSPIGKSYQEAFTGVYDGQGYIVDSLFIKRTAEDRVGLFGYLRGTISNVHITNAIISGRNYVGALLGSDYYANEISECSVDGEVRGEKYIGGLVGDNYHCNIRNSYSGVSVSGAEDIGGLMGNSEGADIVNSYSYGTVSGDKNAGGLIGEIRNYSTIKNSYSYAFVSGSGSSIGGLAGTLIGSTVENCFWDSSASGQTTSAAGIAKSSDEMKTAQTYTDLSCSGLSDAWDLLGNLSDDEGNDDIWGFSSENNGYPILLSGDEDDLLALTSTDSLGNIAAASLTVYGNITFLGSENPTAHGFCWSENSVPNINDDSVVDLGSVSTTGTFESEISGLTAGTIYYVRSYAANAYGIIYGKVIKFYAGKTIVQTDSLSNFSDGSVIAHGTISALGAGNTTMHGFCWNTKGTPDTTDNKTDEGEVSVTGSYSSTIIGLTDGQQYYIRAYAVNETGISYGKEICFISYGKPQGSGTVADPYQIATLGNLYWLSQNADVWNAVFEQTEDINAALTKKWDYGKGFSPIGLAGSNFSGKYHGKRHSIDSLYINRPGEKYLGLFGTISHAKVDSLDIINVDISGYSQIGALAGLCFQSSEVTACYTNGNVTASDYFYCGGLTGRNYQSTINSCFCECIVNGNAGVGGIAGDNYKAIINNSYSVGEVYSKGIGGGLVGDFNGGTVNNCYSRSGGNITGLFGRNYNNLGVSNNCFWDSTASGQTNSYGGTGKSTRDMKNYYTFTDTVFSAGLDSAWDFIGNVNDDLGNENVWDMDQSGSGYPILTWQKEADDILNTPPTLSALPDTISFRSDSSAVINIWDYAEDVDMPDSLLTYKFSISEDSIQYDFDKSTGMLTLSSNGTFVGTAQLVIESADYVESVKDSLIIKVMPVLTGISENNVPLKFSLSQNYPNPFNPTTTIEFSLPDVNEVKLVFYNSAGQRIKTVEMGVKQPGYYKFVWNGRNDFGKIVSSGVYFYKLSAGKYSDIKKIVFMK